MNKTLCLLLTTIVATGIGCGGSSKTETPNSTPTKEAATDSTVGENDSGSAARPTVALPDDLPIDVLILPGARPVHVGFAVTTRGGVETKDYAIQLETTKSIEDVIAFYSTECPKLDWEISYADAATVLGKKPNKRFIQVKAAKDKTGQVGFSIHYR